MGQAHDNVFDLHMIRSLLTFALLLFFTACTKTDPTPANELVGNWRLTTYARNGNTSVNPVSVPSDKTVLVSFANNGSFNESYQNTRAIDYSFLGCGGGSYELVGKQVKIRAVCMSSLAGQLFDVVSVDAKRLTLAPGGALGFYTFERQ